MRNFWGGVKINNAGFEEKGISKSLELKEIKPAEVIISMRQHIGVPCETIVSARQKVLVGQVIGKTGVNLPIVIHSSVSGEVVEVRRGDVDSIVIQSDGENKNDTSVIPRSQIDQISADEIKRIIARAGIVGLGGAGFPSASKLDVDCKIDMLIINGCECEPLLATDDYLMSNFADEILLGAVLARKALNASEIIIVIENNKTEAIKEMRLKALSYSGVSVEVFDAFYPQGGEKQVIQALTGLEVPDGGLPKDLGIMVFNVATVQAFYNAVYFNKPLTHRVITVCGDVVMPTNVLAPIGTKICDLIDFCGGFLGSPARVIDGGPMMGKEVSDLEKGTSKTTGGILVINQENYKPANETQCIRCGKCSDVCPIALDPKRIDAFYIVGDLNRCDMLKARSCINCGCCSFVCPADRDLAYRVVAAKNEINALRKAASN